MSNARQPMVLPLRSREYWQDPYPTLDEARAVYRYALSESGEPVVLAIDDVEAVSSHPLLVPLGLDALDRLGITDGPFREWRALSLNARDHDDHRRLRRLVGRAFTPMQVQRVRPLARENAHRLLDRLSAQREMDVQAEYAREIPLLTICAFLGIPDEDRREIEALHFGTEEGFGWQMTPERRRRAEDGIVGLYDYTHRLVERRRAEPSDDLVSALVHVEEEGERLSEAELYAMVVNIIGGAIGSSQSAIANAALLFATYPDQAACLRADPDLDRAAVEECLRFAPPFRSTRRKALGDVHIAGLDLSAGDTVSLSRQAANRDPARFVDPHRFDISRNDDRHVSFGHGPHFCLGQALARANLAEAIPAFVRRCHDLEVVGEPQRVPFDPTEKFESLVVRYRPAARA
jgi:cytochrome P450